MTAQPVEPEPTTSGAEVVPIEVSRAVLYLREHPKASLSEVMEHSLDALDPWVGKEAIPFPPVAPEVVLTDEVKEALVRLPGVFAKVQPTERRTLTEQEVADLYAEDLVLKQVEEVLNGRREAIKTSIRHHLDVDAEEANRAIPKPVIVKKTGEVKVEATPRDTHGHYVLAAKGEPERLLIPGTNKNWAREFRGGSVRVDGARLEDLHEAGEVTREDYLAFTREKRVFDEEKARTACTKQPRLFSLLARLTTTSGASTALFIRNNPKSK